MFEGQSSHLPLKLNTSGVIPPIFASSLLLLPTTRRQLRLRAGAREFGDYRRSLRRSWDARPARCISHSLRGA
jgi:preprotein translocase subunit SecY